jgi:hypothetical protein
MRLRACAGKRGGVVFCLVALVLLAVPLGGARAQDVHPGFDFYKETALLEICGNSAAFIFAIDVLPRVGAEV